MKLLIRVAGRDNLTPAMAPTRVEAGLARLGEFVRLTRERKGLTQIAVATAADMRNTQVSLLETGANVEVQFYERIAQALGFRGSLEMFQSGGDDLTRRMLKLWKALPDDEARKDVLRLMRQQIVADAE